MTVEQETQDRKTRETSETSETSDAERKVTYYKKIAAECDLKPDQVQAVWSLFRDGGTIPFIARYRKEATGSLDEVAITTIRDRFAQLEELDQRRAAIIKSLEERELLDDQLKADIDAAETLAVLEDIYLPFRPKRRTRAMIAREKGLEPLAQQIFTQETFDLEGAAADCIDEEKGVASMEEALAGARDIIAEWVNEDAEIRAKLRDLFHQAGKIQARVIPGKEEEGQKFRDYFESEEPLASAPSHRILAMRRGEKEAFLSLRIQPPEEAAITILEKQFLKAENAGSEQVRLAVHDSYKRLLCPSLETEARLLSKNQADEEAIRVFADNLRQLLLAPPLGQKRILAIDPGFRTGCKVVCLDEQGKLLHHDVIYPHRGSSEREAAAQKVKTLCARFSTEALAVGNGTAGRETETFLHELPHERKPPEIMVNESGASVYSVSEAAREEFPDQDVTVRGAVSIGRRLQDPLAELVKIDPKSIGVGQYQHDVSQPALKQSLDDVVVSCVNAVGVEVNTASKQLLTYVSGLGPQLAQNIIDYRNANGPFKARQELKKVPRLGPKAFEQSAGFLRVKDGKNPLDGSAVHPESYSVVSDMARGLNCKVQDLLQEPGFLEQIRIEQYVSEKVGLPTLKDILSELAKPGRDPRESFELFRFAEGVNTLEDLKTGMRLPGKVTNITRFGAFVDIGVHQDGLVHISQMADRFIKDPAEVVRLGQTVSATVLAIDLERSRISLSLRETPKQEDTARPDPPKNQVKAKGAGKPQKKRKPLPEASKEKLDPNNPFVKALKETKWSQ